MIATIASEIISISRANRRSPLEMKYAVTIAKRPISKPLRLMMASKRVTIEPAISLAFARLAPRRTSKRLGATAAPKKIAAPNQAPRSSRLSVVMMPLILNKIDLLADCHPRQQSDHGRLQLRLLKFAWVRDS